MTARLSVRALAIAVVLCAGTGTARAGLEIDEGASAPRPIVRKAGEPPSSLVTGGIPLARSAEAPSVHPFAIANSLALRAFPPAATYRDDTARRNALRAQIRARAFSRDWYERPDNGLILPCCYFDLHTLW